MRHISFIITGLFIMYFFYVCMELKKYKDKDIYNTMQLSRCDFAYKENIKMLDSIEKELIDYRDHVKRMQIIAGVKNVDSVFTWKEKVLNPVDTRTLIYK